MTGYDASYTTSTQEAFLQDWRLLLPNYMRSNDCRRSSFYPHYIELFIHKEYYNIVWVHIWTCADIYIHVVSMKHDMFRNFEVLLRKYWKFVSCVLLMNSMPWKNNNIEVAITINLVFETRTYRATDRMRKTCKPQGAFFDKCWHVLSVQSHDLNTNPVSSSSASPTNLNRISSSWTVRKCAFYLKGLF